MDNIKSNLSLCKILSVEHSLDMISYNVESVEICLINEDDECEILTGQEAGSVIPKIKGNDSDDEYCVWVIPISSVNHLFGTYDLEELKNSLDEMLYGKKYMVLKNQPGVILMTDDEDELDDTLTNDDEKTQMVDSDVVNCLNVSDVIDKVRQNVISQDNAIRKIVTVIYGNQKLFNSNLTDEEQFQMKKNLLIVGESGVGKTEIIRQLTKILKIPYTIVTANDYTIAGYKGKDVDSILLNLLAKTGNDMKACSKAVVIVDEIDKICTRQGDDGITSDGVQNALLKMIEGSEVEVTVDQFTEKTILFDTKKITFVFLGAFEKIYDKKRSNNTLGFNSSTKIENKEDKLITIEDLEKAGLVKEFLGRISSVVTLKNLDETDFEKIIKNSNISALKLIMKYYNSLGVNLVYDDNFISYVAKEAFKQKQGARGIKRVLDNLFNEVDTEILDGKIKEVNCTGNVITRIKK